MKLLLAGQGITIGPYEVITARQWQVDRAAALRRVASLGLPVFVKPARAGSSIGISRVTDVADLPAAIARAQGHDPKVVIEAEIRGRELECGVLQGLDGSAQASEIGEIALSAGQDFYDFEAKYVATDDVQLSTPADIPAAVRERVQALAVQTFEAMGCEGLARVDVFYTDDGDVIVNELNTMPGFTEHSMYPQLWAATGVDYATLVDRLLQLALHRPTGLR
jgi:D-alanine-D-alanine ligase